jgi:hypothetical protein
MADRAHAFTGMGEMHQGREDFVRLKIQQLREYYEELGEETDVSYEPPPLSSQTTQEHEAHSQVSYPKLSRKQI